MSIEVLKGPMFSGKTTRGQEITRTWRRQGKRVLRITSAKDTRKGNNARLNVSHDNLAVECIKTASLVGFVLPDDNVECIWIDEGQFMEGLVEFCCEQRAVYGRHILVTGLQSDIFRKPWQLMSELEAVADKVENVQSYCVVCNKATSLTRLIYPPSGDNSNVVVVRVGGDELYTNACWDHFDTPISAAMLQQRHALLEELKQIKIA